MTSVLEELLKEHQISDFSRKWVKEWVKDDDSIRAAYAVLKKIGLTDSKIATQAQLLGMHPDSIDRNYQYLSKLGLSDTKIVSQAQLLGMHPDTIKKNYQGLSKLGLSDTKIVSQAQLLGMHPDTIKKNYQRLSKLGLSDSKIASQAHLLDRDPDKIERNYQRLSKLGLSDSKIASQAQLLGMHPDTIERNYQNHIGLLRENYKDRNSGRDILLQQAQLLGISSDTLEANMQWFADRNISYGDGLLLGTKPQTKRKKLAWILREIFDYRELNQEEKNQAIQSSYGLIRDNPQLLIYSINTLEKKRDQIRKKMAHSKRPL